MRPLLLLALLVPGAAAVTLESVVVKPTFECIGVRVEYSGDEDGDAAVGIRYREKGAADWRDGHPLIRITKNRFVTSLFWLKEDTAYEIELAPSDPGGVRVVFPQPLETRTRSSEFPAAGREWHVDASAGDGGDGSAGSPFRTIQRASQAASAGDVIRIRPGVYREEVRPARSGAPEAWIRYLGEGAGVLLDGGEDIPTESGWTDHGGGVYSRPYARSPRYMALDAVRLYRHSSLDNLRNGGDGIDGGFFTGAGVLYVRAPAGGPLDGRKLRAAVLGYGFYLDNRSYIEIRGVEIAYYNDMGVRFRDSHHCALRDSTVHDSRQMVYVDRILSTDNLIEGNHLWGSGVPGWPWAICHHDHDCSSNGVYITAAGEGNVVRRNHVTGLFNGIYLGGWVEDYPEEWALENEVSGNLLEEIKDDAIEPECHGINLRIFSNHMRNLFMGVSLAPIETGPTWVLYNLVHTPRPHEMGRGYWVKISTTPTGAIPMGHLRIYHNTTYYTDPEHNGWSSIGSGNTYFLNNTVACTRYVFENTSPQRYPPGNVWDYNNFYTTNPSLYVKWENVRLDQAGFRALGFQLHGVSAPPSFRDPGGDDFRPTASDPGIDQALYLPGINDGYTGNAPDIGAFEYTEPEAGEKAGRQEGPSARRNHVPTGAAP